MLINRTVSAYTGATVSSICPVLPLGRRNQGAVVARKGGGADTLKETVRRPVGARDGPPRREPHDVFTWMRQNAPVYFDETSGVWAITRYQDLKKVAKAPDVWSSAQGIRPDSPASRAWRWTIL